MFSISPTNIPSIAGEFVSTPISSTSIKMNLSLVYGTSSHAIWPFDIVKRWDEFDLYCLPPIETPPITLTVPLDFSSSITLIKLMRAQNLIPNPEIKQGTITMPITGLQLEENFEKLIGGETAFEKIISSYCKDEITRHLSM